MKKIFLALFILLATAVVVFYFTASLSLYRESEYDKIVTYQKSVAHNSDTFSVVTYNIGYLSGMTNNLPVDRPESLFSDNLSKTLSLFDSLDLDFVGLQEVDFSASRSYEFNQFDSLGYRLGFHKGAYAVNWDKLYVPFPYWPINNHFGKIYSGQGILSKMQLISNQLEVLRKPVNTPFYYNKFYLDRILQISKIQLGVDTLVLMNVHLEAFDQETRALQAERVLQIFKQYAENYPVVLLGDFNSRPPFASDIKEGDKTTKIFFDDPAISEAISKQRYLKNEANYFTFNTGKPFERLDYIFYTNSRIQRIESDVLREAEDISDHLPVWMTFTLIKGE